MGKIDLIAPPDSAQAERYRALRSRLLNHATPYSGQRVFGIVSPQESAESAIVAGNLAVSLAQSERTVALIDADFRTTVLSIDHLFEVDALGGLANVLSLDSDEIEVPWQTGESERLQILCRGQRDEKSHPGDLLLSPRLGYFLEHMRETADLVLLNLPALEHPESSWVASHTDGVLLVVERGKTTHQMLDGAKKSLAQTGTPILGTIFVKQDSLFVAVD